MFHRRGCKWGFFCFLTERDWAQKSCYGNSTKGAFCFFCDVHLWCEVSRTLLQYFQRYRLFSIFHFSVANNMTSSLINLHDRKTSTSLKRKKIFQKEKKSPFATSTVEQRVLLGTEIVSILSLVPSLDWVG